MNETDEVEYDEEEKSNILEQPEVFSFNESPGPPIRALQRSYRRIEPFSQEEGSPFLNFLLNWPAKSLSRLYNNIFDNRLTYFSFLIGLVFLLFWMKVVSIEEAIVGVITSMFLLLLIRVSPPESIVVEEDPLLVQALRSQTAEASQEPRIRNRRRSRRTRRLWPENFEQARELRRDERAWSPQSEMREEIPPENNVAQGESNNEEWDYEFLRINEVNQPMENRRERRRQIEASEQDNLIDILRRVHFLANQLRSDDLWRRQPTEENSSPFTSLNVPFFTWYDFQQWMEIQEAQIGGNLAEGQSGKKGLSREDIEAIQNTKFEEVSNAFGLSVCSICLDKFAENSECKVLSCQHLFHSQCVSEWLKMSSECPNCKIPHNFSK